MVARRGPVPRARAARLVRGDDAAARRDRSLPEARTLDVARSRVPHARFVRGDALALPFADGAFDRLLTSHFYGHLEGADRERFLAEARRVARELVVVDSALRPGVGAEERQVRRLDDGSRWQVYKRYFTPEQLAAELGGDGETLFAGTWFVGLRNSY